MNSNPALVFLHFLGGSAAEWTPVIHHLSADFTCVPLDLPGFGDAAASRGGFDVSSMAEAITRELTARAVNDFVLVGHSMGAKVATVMARQHKLPGMLGLVLLSGSPPSPEPMAEERRAEMLRWFLGDAQSSRTQARGFIAANANPAVDGASAELLVQQVLRMNVRAWQAWLESGSREDWSARVGRLALPTLLLAGAEDPDLGPEAQRALMLPHFSHARVTVLPGTRHLATIECPSVLAAHISHHAHALGDVPASYRALLASERTSEPTRQALRARLLPDEPAYAPRSLSPEAFAILRVVIRRVLPQPGPAPIDLAARLDAQLADGNEDGWRYAELPPDPQAWEQALRTLDSLSLAGAGSPFVSLAEPAQDALLAAMLKSDTDGPVPQVGLSSPQLFRWFEDLRAGAVRLYLSHPVTLARMAYSGVFDGARSQGFQRIGPQEREHWEPESLKPEAP